MGPIIKRMKKKRAGCFLPGVWGCPPALKSPPRLGDYGVD